MDPRPKRRVLSLSLSQPSKQHKKPRFRRQPSASVENESHSQTCDSQKNSIARDSHFDSLSQSAVSLAVWETQSKSPSKAALRNEFTRSEADMYSTNKASEDLHVNISKTDGGSTEFIADDQSKMLHCGKSSGKVVNNAINDPCNTIDGIQESIGLKGQFLGATKLVFEEEVECVEENSAKFSVTTKHDPSEVLVLPSPHKEEMERGKLDRKGIHERGSTSPAVLFPSASNHGLLIDSGATEVKAATDTSFNQASLEVLQCPLCYKNFDKLAAKTTHVKGCALKHKLSTHQLIEVLELQRKQAAERRALGLPDIPAAAGNSKKPAAPKKDHRAATKMDNNLQLAMALSLSLQDQQQALDSCLNSESSSGMSLDHFGFTSKVVMDSVHPRPSTSLSRGKSKSSVKKSLALLTRTPEERQRIITEKVAMVLLEEVNAEKKEVSEAILKSSFLRQCQDKESMLWAKSYISPSKSDRSSYYVDNLRGFISQSTVEAGSKVLHLSQVVGRVTSPLKEQRKPECPEAALTTSPSEEEISSDSCSPQPQKPKTPSHLEMELRAKFFNDWAGMVNNTSMSDLAIYPKEGREIPTHKIILHVRCSRILRDISRQRNTLTGNEVEVIIWSNTPHAAALAFLEYVYCGSVKSIRVLSEDLSSIIWLANHYRISDLIRYLKAVTESCQTPETPSQVALKAVSDSLEPSSFSKKSLEIREVPKVVDSEEVADCLHSSMRIREHHGNFLAKQPQSHDKSPSPIETHCRRSETESIYSEATLAERENRSLCSSPDMFDDDFTEQDVVPTKGSMGSNAATDRQKCRTVLMRNLRSELDRSPLCPLVVSSEKTAVTEKTSSELSPCASISSEKTDLVENNSTPPSPALSQASAATEILDFDQSVLKGERVSLNDSKRKLSDSPQDNDNCKKQRPISPRNEAQSNKKDNDVELCDLTQDSDSNASFPVVQNFSGDSCEKVSISSGHDMSDVESLSKRGSVCGETNYNQKHTGMDCSLDKPKGSDSNTLHAKSVDEVEEAYISPVWDGFEDMNYEDPFLFSEPPVGELSLATDKTSPAKQLLSPSIVEKLSPEFKNQTLSPGKNKLPLKNDKVNERHEMESGSSSDCEVTYHSPVVTVKPSNSGYEALLDDSFNINNSFLQQAEIGLSSKLSQRETKGTPLNRVLSTETDGVTPLANYSAMKTPQLKRELQKFGLKPTLGKKKGKIMLRHIYNELHPWVPVEANGTNVPEKSSLSQPSPSNVCERLGVSSSQPNSRKLTFSDSVGVEKSLHGDVDDEQDNSDSDSDASGGTVNTSLQEIRFLEGDCDEPEAFSQVTSQPGVSKANLPKVVSEFLTHDKELHQKVLEFEPIWIEKLQLDLRSNGFKFKMEDLMAFLDEKCITFRTNQSGPRTKKRKQKTGNTKKKTAGSKKIETNQLSDSE